MANSNSSVVEHYTDTNWYGAGDVWLETKQERRNRVLQEAAYMLAHVGQVDLYLLYGCALRLNAREDMNEHFTACRYDLTALYREEIAWKEGVVDYINRIKYGPMV